LYIRRPAALVFPEYQYSLVARLCNSSLTFLLPILFIVQNVLCISRDTTALRFGETTFWSWAGKPCLQSATIFYH